MPCERDGRCGYTGYPIEGDEQGQFRMDVEPMVQVVADLWYEITSISPRSKFEVFEKKQTKIYWVPTLQMLDTYLSDFSVKHLNMDKRTLKDLIFAFHRVYTSVICQS